MDLWNYFRASATTLWDLRDARAGASRNATEYDSNKYDFDDSDKSGTAHSLEDNLSRFLLPGWTLLDLSEQVAYDLDEFELETNVPDSGLEKLAWLIAELSISSIPYFTSSLFDLILTHAEMHALTWRDLDIRRGIYLL